MTRYTLVDADEFDALAARVDAAEARLDALEAGPPTPPPGPLPSLIEVGGGANDFAELSDIDWSLIQPNTTILVHHRVSAYVAKVVLHQSGCVLEGVSGAGGEKPVIDGRGAQAHPNLPYAYSGPGHEQRGIVAITGTAKPSNITVRNFEMLGCYEQDTFVDRAGDTQNYLGNAACVYVERGDNVTVEDCDFSLACHGTFVSSADTEQTTSRNFVQRRCTYHLCGNQTGSADEQSYVEAAGHTVEDCTFGFGRDSGSIGTTCLHDRSSGLVVRDSTFDGSSICILANSPTEAAALTISEPDFHDIAFENCLFKSTGNIGNVLAIRSETTTALARRNVTIDGCTIHRVADQPTKYSTVACSLGFAEQSIDYTDTLFKTEPVTQGAASNQLWLATGGNNAGTIRIGAGCTEEHNAASPDMGGVSLGSDPDTIIEPVDWRNQIPVTVV